MKVKIKKLVPEAVIPTYAKPGDAGMDLVAVSTRFDKDGNLVYGTGLCFEIPEGYVGLLFPRSSNSKVDLTLSNSVGVLDSGYRGEVMFKFKPTARYDVDLEGNYHFDGIEFQYDSYKIGDRIGQLIIMPYPEIEFEEVEELSQTERGKGGYGSTGR